MTEWSASAYNHISTLQQVMAEKEIRRLTLAGGERILDVGCGDGKVTAEIADLVPRGSVLGIDPSHNMIEFATRHFGPAQRANLRFEVADGRRMNYRDEFETGLQAEPGQAIWETEDFEDEWLRPGDALAIMQPGTFERFRRLGLPMQVLLDDPRRVLVRKP